MKSSSRPDPKHLLGVLYYYPPVPAVGGLRPHRFLSYLPEFGYTTAAIAARSQANLTDTPTVRFVPPDHAPPPSSLAKLSMRVLNRVFNASGHRLDWTAPGFKAASEYIRQNNVGTILTSYPPLSSALIGLRLKRKFPYLRWVADFRDPFAYSPFQDQLLRHQIERRIEPLLLRHADLVLTVTDALSEEFRHRYPAQAHKVHTIYNGFDPSEPFGPAPKPSRAESVIAHVGDLYGGRHPIPLLESLVRLSKLGMVSLDRIKLLLLGAQDSKPFQDWLNQTPAQDRSFLELRTQRVPREEAMQLIASADRLLLLDMNEKNLGHTVPGKLFDYLRAGHPQLVFTPSGSMVEKILSQSGVPYVAIDPKVPGELVDKQVMAFLDLPAVPTKPSTWFWNQFDGRRQVAGLAQLLEQIE